MKTILLIFMLVCGICAQGNNVHVAVGSWPSVEGGIDYNFTPKTTGAADVLVSRICKDPGGCGHQVDVRGVVAQELKKPLSIQGGVVYTHYNVPLFGKTAVQVLGGVRFKTFNNRFVPELNYRQDLTSENKVKSFENRGSFYLKRHIFIRYLIVVKRFRDFYNQPRVQADAQISAGLYF